MNLPIWLTTLGVVGTWILAIAAIWGDRIKAFLFRPSLVVELLNTRGDAVDMTDQSKERKVKSRYYHLCVTNSRRFSAAHDVQIVITNVEQEGPDGRPQMIYTGLLPLGWRFPQINPISQIVGPPRHADFLFVTERPQLNFTPIITPNNFCSQFDNPAHLWVTVIARATECESDPIRIEVAWDGKWDAGEAEMTTHLKFSVSGPLK